MQVNVYQDPVYGTAVFETLSGMTMCPHENGTLWRDKYSAFATKVGAAVGPCRAVPWQAVGMGSVGLRIIIGAMNPFPPPPNVPHGAEGLLGRALQSCSHAYQQLVMHTSN